MYSALFSYHYACAKIKYRETKWRCGAKMNLICPKACEKNPMVTIAPLKFPKLFQRGYSPASFDSYSPGDKESDSSECNTGVSEACSSRKKKQKGWRSVWEERHVSDLVYVICSSEYYKKS